jgi:hypothetical protein
MFSINITKRWMDERMDRQIGRWID